MADTMRTMCNSRWGEFNKMSCKVRSPTRNCSWPIDVPYIYKSFNDLGDNISSTLRLFADDSLLYLTVSSLNDCQRLQDDLNQLISSTNKWQMTFNASKCFVLRITNKRTIVDYNYTMHGQQLKKVSHNPYLGVELSSNLSWDHHINNITAKANRSLAFIRRNLGNCPETIKKQAYVTLVRPHVEYASSVWDPHLQKHIQQIEMIQRRSARFIKRSYSNEPGTVSSILKELNLTSLQVRRKINRLLLLHKIIHKEICVPLPSYAQPSSSRTRQFHPSRFASIGTNTNTYKHSFFPKTLLEWSSIPTNIIEVAEYEAFKARLIQHITN